MSHIKLFYKETVNTFTVFSTFVGFTTGLGAGVQSGPNSFDFFANVVGYTSIGIIAGYTYPVSFPLLAGYALLKDSKKK